MSSNLWKIAAAKAYESFRADWDGELPDWNALKPDHQESFMKAVRVGVRVVISEGKKQLVE